MFSVVTFCAVTPEFTHAHISSKTQRLGPLPNIDKIKLANVSTCVGIARQRWATFDVTIGFNAD